MEESLQIAEGNNFKPVRFSSMLGLWCLFFIYAAIVALLVQLVLLPYVFPAWHAGNGMLVGGDWLQYHKLAVELAHKINSVGWSAWVLRPDGQAPAGIAGAVYALTIPKPWTIIPLNASLFATAGLFLLRLIQVFVPRLRTALLCTLPFLCYPSAAISYTQIQKDGYFIAGAFMFIYGWIALAHINIWKSKWWLPLKNSLWVFLGAFLVWLVRPYGVQMMQAVSVGLSLVLSGVFLARGLQRRLPWAKVLLSLTLIWIMIVFLTPLTKGGLEFQAPVQPAAVQDQIQAVALLPVPVVNGTKEHSKVNAEQEQNVSRKSEQERIPGRFLTFINNKFVTISIIREGFRTGYPDAGSNIDTNTSFHTLSDMIKYVPRALEIAFLAPFPNQWFENGTLQANTMMRRISAIEMVGVYFSLIFLPYMVWRWRRRVEIWLIIIFCGGMMLIYGLVVPNVGTLYRWRYGFIMTMAALGLAGIFVAKEKNRCQVEESLEKRTEI